MPYHVLLTGANGFVAQHILSQLLKAGHSVRAVVRTQSKVDQLSTTFRAYTSTQLESHIVPDITAPLAFDAALTSSRPFDAVIHTASPFNYRAVSSNLEFLDPAVKGTTEILSGIKRVAPSVKRVVLTSSMAAVIDWGAPKETDTPKVYTDADWNPITWDDALATESLNLAYSASKSFAERAAWDFISDNKPGFDLVTINPPMVYGPYVDPSVYKTPQELNQSNFNLWRNFLEPSLTSESPLPPNGLHLYVDVRDMARAHVLALLKPEAGGKRFVVGGGAVSNQKIANIFRDTLPQLADRIPKGKSANAELPKGLFTLDASPARQILGLEFSGLEDTFTQVAIQLVKIAESAEKST
ncbi:nad dependent epimerase dehydratase [Colletotrichum incanum]|uniref:Nad dependent epimerase dehydratase n=1 Tax=Colletotrichum incanum TaxID=1573173 RepID=A0A161WN65_COLIC|nr:nad dependent epimerase dehydratase [Colletotrichum incanum]OHX01091.1 NAD-dependent epimerase dehydratase [Colletotrichum incanum]